MNFDERINKKKILTSFSWQMLNRVFTVALNFVIQITMARLLEPSDFGAIAILNTIIGFAGIFVEAGISTSIIQKKEIDGDDLFTALVISVSTAVIFYVIFFATAPYFLQFYNLIEITLPLRAVSIVMIFNALNSIYTAMYIRKLEFRRMFVRSLIASPLSGIIGIFLAINKFGIWALVFQQISFAIFNYITLIIKSDIKIGKKFSIVKARILYSFGSQILFASIIDAFYDTTRTLMIGKKYTHEELAYYDRAYTYSMYVSQFINTTLSNVILPVFSRKQDNKEMIVFLSRRVVKTVSFIAFPIFIGLAAVSQSLIYTLLSDKWGDLIPYFMIFCFLRVLGVVQNVDKQAFFALGRSDIVLKYTLIALVLNISSLLIASKHGVMAIAISRFFVEVVVAVCVMCLSSYVTGYDIRKKINDFYKPLVSSLVMFLIIYNLKKININNSLLLILQIFCGIFIYIFMAFILKDDSLEYTFKLIQNFIKERPDE